MFNEIYQKKNFMQETTSAYDWFYIMLWAHSEWKRVYFRKIERSTKKKLRKKIKDKFFTSATLLENNEQRLIFLPKDLLQDDPAIKVVELQKKLNLYQQDSLTEKSLDIAAEAIWK